MWRTCILLPARSKVPSRPSMPLFKLLTPSNSLRKRSSRLTVSDAGAGPVGVFGVFGVLGVFGRAARGASCEGDAQISDSVYSVSSAMNALRENVADVSRGWQELAITKMYGV